MDQTAKQQVVESIKQATNVLVTVSANPSVDQLSAALGLTLMLSKLEKHATAVFSGQVPEAIKFLEADKTLESNVDSLRDFIIALDKNKADKLRYKVEDDVVRIFITPYKTKITKDDFQFSQGDFNVDVVVALGVEKREELDSAIKAHGRILHDSTVVTINSGNTKSRLGAVNWSDDTASSLCEMLVSISESFGSGLLDQQISTAFLTGIVAATERFSNTSTTPKVMTMSAQLMAAGANQQLIANELNMAQQVVAPAQETQLSKIDTGEVKDGDNSQVVNLRSVSNQPPVTSAPADLHKTDDSLPISNNLPTQKEVRDSGKSLKDLESEIAALSGSVHSPSKSWVKGVTEKELSVTTPQSVSNSHPMIPPIESAEPAPGITDIKGQGPLDDISQEPALGGTFNATSSEAHEERVKDRQQDANRTILSHDPDPDGTNPAELPSVPTLHIPTIQPDHPGVLPLPSPSEPDDVQAARAAVNNAVNNQPFNPSNNPVQNLGSESLPLENQDPQQINIDENGMVSLPGTPPDLPDDQQSTAIL